MESFSKIPWLDLAERSCNGCKDPKSSKKEIAGLLERFLSAPTETKLRKTLGEIEFAVRRCIDDGKPNPSLLELSQYLVSLQEPSADISLDSFRQLAQQMHEFCIKPPPPPPPPKPIPIEQSSPILDEVPRRKRSISLKYVQKLTTPEKFNKLKIYFEAKSSNFQYLDFVEFLDVFSRCCEFFIQESREARQLRAKLAEMLPAFITSFGSKEISKTLTAFARLSYEGAIAYKLLFDMACGKIKELNNFQLSNILWVVAVLNFSDQSVVAILAEEAKVRLQTPSELHYFGLKQLYHFHIVSRMLPEAVSPFQERYKQYLEGTLEISERTAPRSQREQEVSDIIHTLVDSHYCEIIDDHREDGLQFDIVIRQKKRPKRKRVFLVDVEVDGRFHSPFSLQHKLRNRILNIIGWGTVIRISNDEYSQNSRDEITNIIRRKLERIGIKLAADRLNQN